MRGARLAAGGGAGGTPQRRAAAQAPAVLPSLPAGSGSDSARARAALASVGSQQSAGSGLGSAPGTAPDTTGLPGDALPPGIALSAPPDASGDAGAAAAAAVFSPGLTLENFVKSSGRPGAANGGNAQAGPGGRNVQVTVTGADPVSAAYASRSPHQRRAAAAVDKHVARKAGKGGKPLPPAGATALSGTLDATLKLDTRELMEAHGMQFLNPAAGVPLPAPDPVAVSSKQALCIEILTHGFVNSYVDFFYLTHRTEDAPAAGAGANAAGPGAGAGGRNPIRTEDLGLLMKYLTQAERAHRRVESEAVYDAHQQLGNYFRDHSDYKTAIYFYEKCLDIAESSDKYLAQQADSNYHLGRTYDALKESLRAITFHERHLAIARQLRDTKRIHSANQQLVDAYRKFAEEMESKDNLPAAVEYYSKCLHAANEAGDLKSEGVATYRLGLACAKLGVAVPTGPGGSAAPAGAAGGNSMALTTTAAASASSSASAGGAGGGAGMSAADAKSLADKHDAIRYQHKYLEICRKTNDSDGEGAACAALARAFQELGDLKQAVSYLEKYRAIAARTKQRGAEAEACSALGSIWSSQGAHDRAVEAFKTTFDIAMALGDRKLLDHARVNLGMARGNLQMGLYMNIVNHDLPALLKWKTQRRAITKDQKNAGML